jgi:hypothetical protein
MTDVISEPRHDPESDIAAWLVGSGIFLIEVCAVIPGLLPFLLLLLPLVLPFVLLGLLGGVMVGVPLGLWRLAAWAARPLIRHLHSLPPTPETNHA